MHVCDHGHHLHDGDVHARGDRELRGDDAHDRDCVPGFF